MKNLLASLLVLVSVAAIADTAVETVQSSTTISNSTTATVSTGTYNPNWVPNQSTLGVELAFTGSTATTTGAVTVVFARSLNKTTIETTPKWTWAVTANGTNSVVACTNLPAEFVGSWPYIKVVSIANGTTNSGANLTSATLKVVKKSIKQ